MVVEWLRFDVPEARQAEFLAMDAAIWTVALARQPGFVRKEIWRAAGDPRTLNLVIHWASREAWHAVPRAVLDEATHAFEAALGETFPVLGMTEYRVEPG
jgi:uncharacterized protein (TIGR03792 family)